MGIRWGRLLVGTAVAEVVSVGLLILLVALMGPRDQAEAEEFAVALGFWVGPIAGALTAMTMAGWVARPLGAAHVLHGLLLGVLLAIVDVVVLVATRVPFNWMFVISNAGKVVAGSLGGLVASRLPSPAVSR